MTIHRGSEKEDGVTRIGSHNLLMVNVHVAHDCMLGDRVIIANNTILGGHCHVESYVTISGGVGVHPFVTIGDYSYVGRPVADLPRRPPLHDRRRQSVEGPLHQRRRPAAPRPVGRGDLGPARGPSADLPGQDDRRTAAEILESHGHLCPEVKSLLDFIEAQHLGKQGRARERWRKA